MTIFRSKTPRTCPRGSEVVAWAWRFCAVSNLLACGYAGDELQVTDPAIVGAIQVDSAIASGGQRVTRFAEHGDWSIVVARAPGDRTLTAVSTAGSVRKTQLPVSFLVGDASGVRKVSPDSADAGAPSKEPLIRAVEGGPNPLVLFCGGTPLLYEASPDGTLASASVNQGLCDAARGGVVGASRDGNSLLVASSSGALLTVQTWSRDALAAPDIRSSTTSGAGCTPLAVAGSASGGVLVVCANAVGTVYLTDTKGAERIALAEGDDYPARAWIETADERVVWSTRAGVRVEWSTLDGPDEPPVRYVPKPPGISEPDMVWSVPNTDFDAVSVFTVPNERAAAVHVGLSVPVRAAALQWRASSKELVRTDAATTPCASRATCRLVGESMLLGVIPNPTGALGVYSFWSWSDLEAVVIAPLVRPEEVQ